MQPDTRYTRSGDIHIAYQIVGEGSLDLVFCHGWLSNLELMWEEPSFARFLQRLSSFSRLILFDKRGTGLSDRVAVNELPSLEQRMDDIRVVLDAARSRRSALFGFSEGGVLASLYAATYPERVSALILYGTPVKMIQDPSWPVGFPPELFAAFAKSLADNWEHPIGLELWAPSVANDERMRRWWERYLRQSASPQAAITMMKWMAEIDMRPLLSAIRVPTLVLHRTDEVLFDVEQSRYLGRHIPGAKLIELAGVDHLPFVGDSDSIADEVQEFMTGVREPLQPDRVLATVLFVDISESTRQAAQLGDRAWRDRLGAFRTVVREQLKRYRGVEIDTAGDGFLATFDGPGRALRCASAIREGAGNLGIAVRAGVHTGEVEVLAAGIAGLAVHVGARIAALAPAGQILVSGTVRDLVTGSGFAFVESGSHALRGIPGEWKVFALGEPSFA
jgi:class 3 adenylate cyclase